MKIVFILIGIIFVVGFSAFNFSPFPAVLSAADSLTSQRKEKLLMYERSFIPSYYDTEAYLFKKNDSTKTSGASLDQSYYAQPETLQGFRVQLFSTAVYDDASAFRNSLSAAFPDAWIYMVYEAPSFKIRIGDFTNRSDATLFVAELSKKGFRDGWIVQDKIIKNQQPKPPIPVPIDSTGASKY